MSRPRSLFPSYCHHKAKGLAYVTLGGRVHYLGKYGTEESRREYDRLIAIYEANCLGHFLGRFVLGLRVCGRRFRARWEDVDAFFLGLGAWR